MARLGKIAIVNLALILAALIGAELIFGGWIGANYGILVLPKDFQRRFDVSGLYGHPTRTILYRRDSHGFRGAYADPSRIDLLVMGGSTTNEIFIDEAETWTAVIAQGFAQAGRPISVVNAGVDGQSTIGNLKNFAHWLPRIPGFKARYVLFYLGINDRNVALSGHLNKQDHLFAPRRRVKRYLLNNSALYTLFRNIRGMIRARRAKLIHDSESYDGLAWRAPERPPDLARAEARIAAFLPGYADRLARLAARVRALGAVPIFVTQADATYRMEGGRVLGRVLADGKVDLGAYATQAVINRRTLRTCRRLGAVCIDLAGELFFTDGDHYDDLHTTPQGSAKIGRYLYGRLSGVITPATQKTTKKSKKTPKNTR